MTKWCNFFQHLKVGQLHRNCTGILLWSNIGQLLGEVQKARKMIYWQKHQKVCLNKVCWRHAASFSIRLMLHWVARWGGGGTKVLAWKWGKWAEKRRGEREQKKEGRKKKWELGGRRGGNSHGRKRGGGHGRKGWHWLQGGIFLHRSSSNRFQNCHLLHPAAWLSCQTNKLAR